MPGIRLTVPNVITIARIAACPAIFMMALSPSISVRLWSFVLFVVAGLSDVWDGYLARKYGWITDMGKLLDPLADKLLLAATFIPFFMISHRGDEAGLIPWWGAMPLWVIVVILGREIIITGFRSYAASRGVVIAAGVSGKRKALLQALFSGGLLLWYPLLAIAGGSGWDDNSAWAVWSLFHEAWIGITLALAIILTVYSMLDYLWRYRSVVSIGR